MRSIRPSSLVLALGLATGCASGGTAGTVDSGTDGGHAAGGFDASADAQKDATQPRDAAADTPVISIFGDASQDVGADTGTHGSLDGSIDGHVDGAHDGSVDGRPADAADASNRDAEKDVGVDAAPPATVLFLGTSSTGVLAGTRHPGGTWSSGALGTTGSASAPVLTTLSNGTGVGAFTASTSGAVTATVWTAAGWGTPVGLAAGAAVAQAAPAIDGTGGTTAHLVYQDASFKFQYLAYSGGTWSASSQPVGGLYGPVPASVAALGSNASVGFVDGTSTPVNSLASSDRVAGVFSAANDLGAVASFTVPPAIVPLSSGPQLLFVYVDQGANIRYATRTGGTWSATQAITNALTGNPVALAPLPGGDAILAFRGQDTNLYWSLYSAGAWSTVAPFSGAAMLTIEASPAVAHGVGGDVAEMAFVESSGAAYSSSLTGVTWSTPVLIGGSSLVGVAIAATP